MDFFFPLYRALQEAQDIFGVDFNFDEFDQYGDDYEEDEDEEEEDVSIIFFHYHLRWKCLCLIGWSV